VDSTFKKVDSKLTLEYFSALNAQLINSPVSYTLQHLSIVADRVLSHLLRITICVASIHSEESERSPIEANEYVDARDNMRWESVSC